MRVSVCTKQALQSGTTCRVGVRGRPTTASEEREAPHFSRRPTSRPTHPPPLGIEFLKSRGQHILKNPAVVQAIVDRAGVKPTDVVLEIGPGTGNLTLQLLARAKKVVAVEVDPRMVLELKRRVAGTPHAAALQLIQGDVMRVDLPYFDVCVANIPYQISSPLTLKLLAYPLPWRAAVIMYQHEFAMRLAARPGDSMYCRLAVNAQLLARVTHLLKVGRNNFRPPPKVDSSVVRIEPRRPPPPVHFGEWDGFVRLAFGRKNRTLGAAFRQAGTLALLEANAAARAVVTPAVADATAAALASMAVDDSAAAATVPGDDAGDTTISVDDRRTGSKRRPRASDEFRARVEAVLSACGASETRAAKMAQDDFMRVLAAFNAAGIHFA